MKILKSLSALLVIYNMVSCDKNKNENITNTEVTSFIDLLKSDQYNSYNLPTFTYREIFALLQYRNDTRLIHHFPVNPLSSYCQDQCRVGLYVLWTIEAIRTESISSKYTLCRYPSLNPILVYRESDKFEMASDDISYTIVAKAYYDWWINNRDRRFDDFKDIDPLKSTEYRWH